MPPSSIRIFNFAPVFTFPRIIGGKDVTRYSRMIGKMVSLGFDLATLPARMTYRGTRAMINMPGDIEQVTS